MRKLFAVIEQSSDEKRCFKTSTLRVVESVGENGDDHGGRFHVGRDRNPDVS